MRISINPNKEIVERIDKLLDENHAKYGKRFCPCSLVHDDEHVCICKDFLESEENGECHCGKYIKTE